MVEKDTGALERKIGFDGVRAMVMKRCTGPASRQMCEQMSFMTDYDAINQALNQVSELLISRHSDNPLPLQELDNTEPLLHSIKIPGTFLAEADVSRLNRTITAIIAIESYFSSTGSDYPTLKQLCEPLSELHGPLLQIRKTIEKILDKDGQVKDSASPELAEIRAKLRGMASRINTIMRSVVAHAVAEGWIDDGTNPAMRDGRLVLPVSPMHKRQVQGIVHDESASGKTVFIEPAAVVEASNMMRTLEMEQRREVVRVLTLLADEIRPFIPELLQACEILSQLDFINAKASVADSTGAQLPHISENPELEWYHACHPVLQQSLARQGKEIVPIDITLTPEKRILIISGPNAGGKSVCLKTTGVIQYMMQCGMLPTVFENSHMGLFSQIMVDIGDDQSIEDDLSTYSSHLRNMKRMLLLGGGTTLALIDEFGSGTEPQIGGAIAQAILTQFNAQQMWAVITTHYQNLKQLASDTPGLVNGSMLYDRQMMKPLFKLSIGSPGSSFALEIARKTGLPDQIISQARDIVGSDYVNLDNYLLDITRDKRYWENKRTAIRQKERKLDQQIQKYTEDAETLRLKRREILEDARQQAREIIDTSNSAVERTIHEIKSAQAEKQRTLDARLKLKEERIAMEKRHPSEHELLKKAPKKRKKPSGSPQTQPQQLLEVGSNVRLDQGTTTGTILSIEGSQATVSFGALKTTVPLKRLSPSNKKVEAPRPSQSGIVEAQNLHALQSFKTEIDLRGMRLDEALQAVTYYIDDAIRFSMPRVRILHGTGTGALRQGIRQQLSATPGIARFHDEDVRFGGAGITVVELE